MTGTWSYSLDEELYHGRFPTAEDALREGRLHARERGRDCVYVGQGAAPLQPETYFDIADLLEHVSCQDDYAHECAADWDSSTREQRAEINAYVQALIGGWLDRYNLRPAFTIIDPASVQVHQLADEVADAST